MYLPMTCVFDTGPKSVNYSIYSIHHIVKLKYVHLVKNCYIIKLCIAEFLNRVTSDTDVLLHISK